MNKKIYIPLLLLCLTAWSYAGDKYYVRMADSEMKRNPEAWMLDFSKEPKWNYCHGLVLQAILQTWEKTGNDKYFKYADEYANHTYDPATGLYFHGWDESKTQQWANQETGQSPNFWSRSIGWYMMAIVDVLDFLPENHPKRKDIIDILQRLSASLEKFRDPETGMWYQVTNLPGKEGNYPESTGSIMFIYAWKKGYEKGYLDKSYKKKSLQAYQAFRKEFIRENADGTLSVKKCCAVAGLGGNPYRSGNYEYYISEPVRDNDPKATGPFIMTSIMFNQ